MDRPILNQTLGTEMSPAGASGADAPLATHLPAWDLLPPHALLVRRRALPAGHAASADTAERVPAAAARPPAAAAPIASPPPPASAFVPSPSPSAAAARCRQCGEPLEEGAGFCSECGTSQG